MPAAAIPFLPALVEVLTELPALARLWAPVFRVARDFAITLAALHHITPTL